MISLVDFIAIAALCAGASLVCRRPFFLGMIVGLSYVLGKLLA